MSGHNAYDRERAEEIQKAAEGGLSAVDALVMRMRKHYDQMSPHVQERETAKLLKAATEQIEELHTSIKTANQALLEVNHAQHSGPGWYTKGASGLYQQVAMWVKRGLDATGKHLDV